MHGNEQLIVEFPAGTATVAARVEHLPFRSGAFDAVVGTDAFECMTDDKWGTREFARVLRPGGTALFAVSNAHDLLTLRDRARDVLRARRRPPRAYFHSPRHTREYTWSRFAQLVAGPFHVRRHYTTGFGDRNGTKRALATRLVRTPLLRHFSPAIVIEAEPRVRT